MEETLYGWLTRKKVCIVGVFCTLYPLVCLFNIHISFSYAAKVSKQVDWFNEIKTKLDHIEDDMKTKLDQNETKLDDMKRKLEEYVDETHTKTVKMSKANSE